MQRLSDIAYRQEARALAVVSNVARSNAVTPKQVVLRQRELAQAVYRWAVWYWGIHLVERGATAEHGGTF